MSKQFKERGFSDQLYWLNFRFTWIFVGVCVVLTILSGVLNITDLSIVSYGIPTAFAELGVHTGYIVWKAKSENLNKHPVIVDNQEDQPVNTQAIGFKVEDPDYAEDDLLDDRKFSISNDNPVGFN